MDQPSKPGGGAGGDDARSLVAGTGGSGQSKAREQADKTLKAMGMKIDSLFAISPVSFSEIRTRMFGTDYSEATTERVIVTGSYIGNNAQSEYRVAPVTVSQSIHVIYLIAPAK